MADFRHLRSLGANAIRLYHVPTIELLDQALSHGLRVFVDIPWEKHRCFFEDWKAQKDAIDSARRTAKLLGNHPGLFALSVVNEIPSDIARFYGHRRVERFIETLIDSVKQEAPRCLTTFANYPTAEFLQPKYLDFHCFNVYLDDNAALARYLDRLQHIAGNLPLILGEFGVDSMRHGVEAQSQRLAAHVRQVFRHGLAGSFIFSFTDDWFTGGAAIEDWAFGVTTVNREDKPAALALTRAWGQGPLVDTLAQPAVSVVVCSYNGAATLDECLQSLGSLNYPNYEVILVDDGSQDDTRAIAARYPDVCYHYQENAGLSAARNVGARLASGKIVAYTDSDCMADPEWLTYLVAALQREEVHAVGGPNIPPPDDSTIARCVAASPGGPSHVMLDDRHAEHIPGCNMAFYREDLLSIGGFDVRYRQAGDDVDICWRYLERGWKIGFAPGAVVWHKRRTSIRAYLKQQSGYGRSEALLRRKHLHQVNSRGMLAWRGVIYGEGANGLPLAQPVIYHGSLGSALFQMRSRGNTYSFLAYPGMIEWFGVAAGSLLLAAIWWPLALIAGTMVGISVATAIVLGCQSPLPSRMPRWSRLLVCVLAFLQPLVRGWHRTLSWNRGLQDPEKYTEDLPPAAGKAIGRGAVDLYWDNRRGVGRQELLEAVGEECQHRDWPADFKLAHRAADAELVGDAWHVIEMRTVTEELGWPRRFTRCRIMALPTRTARTVVAWTFAAAVLSVWTFQLWAMSSLLAVAALLLIRLASSRRSCVRSAGRLVRYAGGRIGLAENERVSHGSPRVDVAEDMREGCHVAT